MFKFVGIPQYQRWSGFKLSEMKSKSSRSRAEKVRTGEVTVTSELFQFSSRSLSQSGSRPTSAGCQRDLFAWSSTHALAACFLLALVAIGNKEPAQSAIRSPSIQLVAGLSLLTSMNADKRKPTISLTCFQTTKLTPPTLIPARRTDT